MAISDESSRWVRHTHEVLENLNGLLFSMESVESSARGFVVDGNESYLASLDSSLIDARRSEAAVRRLTADNPRQQAQLPGLENLMSEKVQFAEKVIAARRAQGFESAVDIVRSGHGQKIMSEFQSVVGVMKGEEIRLLALREADARRRAEQTRIILTFGMILGVSIAAAAGWSVRPDSAARELAEQSERQVEDRFRNLANNISQLAWMADEKCSVFWYNERWYEYSGTTAEQMAGLGWKKVVHPDHLDRVVQELNRCFQSGEIWQDTFPLRGKDGSYRMFLARAVPIRDAQGKTLRWVGTDTDISELQNSQKHMAGLEDRYRGLLEAAPDAMVVVKESGEIVLLNVQAEKQFGYSRDEVAGQNVQGIIPEGFAERLIADGTRTTAEALAQQIGTGIELIGRRKDGSEFPIEIMLGPLQSVEGTLVTVAIRNITTRKDLERRVEERTKAIEQQWRNFNTTIASIVDHAFMFDPSGRFVYANQALLDLLERTLEEVVGKTCFELPYTNELAARIQDQIQQVISTRQKVVDVTHYVSPSGVSLYSEYFLSPMIDAEGVVQFVAGGCFDVTKRKIAEVHLEQMEARYRGLLEAAPDGMVVVNQRGDIVLLNAHAEKQFRYWRDELIGQKVRSIIPQGFAERLIADGTRTAAEALAQQIGTGIELTGLRKDGSEFPIEIMLSPLQSVEGILITAAIRDISVRKDAEKHLAQMESRYRGLLEAAPDGMVVVNQGGDILLLNAQAENQFGYRRDELIGQRVMNIIPEGFAERLIADGTRSAAEALAQQIGTGIELTGLRKDGSEFPIEIMLSPLESIEGILITAAIRDISVRKDAEKHLAQMESRYRGLLEAAPDGMVVVNQGGDIVLLNAQAENQFGYRRDELIGQKVTSIIPEGFAERLIADEARSASEALAQQIGTGIELTGLRKDGSEFPIEIMLSPLESTEGILVTAAIRDITIRKEAEAHLVDKVEQLNRSNSELEQFAYIASHDLQEPLRMVASYTQLLSRRYSGKLDSDADEFIAFAVDGANRMQQLIKDLLSYSRVEKKGHEMRDISSDSALQEALINLRGAIVESGALVTHSPLPEVKANEIQLIQLFQNLISNAIKYQGQGVPQIHVSAARNGAPKWIFSIQDNGLGIEPQFFEKIFGMFQRLHKRGEFEGTGIGLAICKKIVECHGGSISVESTPGLGSTFHFSLAATERKS